MKPTSGSHGAGGHHYSPEEMHNDDVAHEHSDINISALIWSMVVMFAVVVGTAVLMAILFKVLETQAEARDPTLSPLALPVTTMPKSTTESPYFGGAPEPKLMTAEPRHLKDVRTSEQQQLHGYGWIRRSQRHRAHPDRRGEEADARARAACAAGARERRKCRHSPAGQRRIVVGPDRDAERRASVERDHARACGSTRGTGARCAQGWGLTGSGSGVGSRLGSRLVLAEPHDVGVGPREHQEKQAVVCRNRRERSEALAGRGGGAPRQTR